MPADDHAQSKNDVTISEVYRLVRRIDETLNGNGQPGLKSEFVELRTRFATHTQEHARGGFTRKQILAYGGFMLTAAGTIAAIVSAAQR